MSERQQSSGRSLLDVEFDAPAVRKKYREERDRRLRPEGADQYRQPVGELSRFVEDPWVEGEPTREPLRDEVDVALIGAGLGGLMIGARLRQAGVQGIRVIDKAGDFGGTWYWNRYPGVSCDIESYIYMPMLEEMGYIPRERYSRGDEILAYVKTIAERFDLYRDACFQTEVTGVRWDDARARWIISTDRDDRIAARFACMANGFLQRPKLPGIPGLETFRGRVFHTSRWDYAYTAGDIDGNLTGLHDKRVGIVGTGATAIQSIPHLGASAAQLYVFQRTPSPVDVRGNHPTDPEWARSLEPGWQERRMDSFQYFTAGGADAEDLVGDSWTDLVHKRMAILRENARAGERARSVEDCAELADFIKMEEIRARVDELVEDPATAEALKPWYRPFCKRPCFHDEYLQTFNRPNVTLVDTGGRGVERITERGAVVEGVEYELDCLIFATGFEVWTEYARRAGYETLGRDGVSLSERWSDGLRTLHGTHVHGFPNLFVISLAQAGVTMNYTYMLNEQSRNLAYIISRALRERVRTLEVTQEAEAQWVAGVLERSADRARFLENCTPGYINNEGTARRTARQDGPFGGDPTDFKRLLAEWRAEGAMQGLEITYEDDGEG